MAQAKLYPRTALVLLTALNLLNYIDRSVLFAVQPLVQTEFHLSNAQIGYLTSAFLGFYMIAAPFTGPLADRYSRKLIIFLGASFWSALTLLTAFTHNYWELLVRHTLVGIGEATFVTIAPTFVADLFPEEKRGRIFGIFYLAIPVGTAAGYILGGKLGATNGWRFPFYIAAAPGFLLALALLFIPEPERGQFDSVKETPERGTLHGLIRNPAFWTATLGMATMTFALGGIQVWMPTFLSRVRGYTLASANYTFGLIVVMDGIVASLAGGWLGDYLLPRLKGAYYFVSAVSMALGVPFMIVALFNPGRMMLPAIGIAAFLLLFNTSPLNAALVNSVGAHIRSTAIALNIFIIHLLGDVPSPTLMGLVADKQSLQAAFILPVIAMVISSVILFLGVRFAPPVASEGRPRPVQAHVG
ncbi:MAG: major facilitator superfamily transporter [Acidobacteriaceae bacterium]|nr:major facilitator superfamily transporter [Acidobacteriaceae bacterium]